MTRDRAVPADFAAMRFPPRRPADLTAALRALSVQPRSASETVTCAFVEKRRAVLAASVDTVGDVFEALGRTHPAPVAEQSRVASASPDKGLLLHRFARTVAPGKIAELGSAFGISGAYLVSGLQAGGGGLFGTVEAASSRSAICAETLRALDAPAVQKHLFVGLFDMHLEVLEDADLVYIDGNHYAVPTRLYVDAARARCRRDALLLLDDIDGYSTEMDNLWRSLSRDRRFPAVGRLGDLGVLAMGKLPALLAG